MTVALLLIAGAASAQQRDEADARFFLLRNGFAPDAGEVFRYSTPTRRQEVERVLAETRSAAISGASDRVDEPLVPAFLDAANLATLVKSPGELVVVTVRQFNFSGDDPLPFTSGRGVKRVTAFPRPGNSPSRAGRQQSSRRHPY